MRKLVLCKRGRGNLLRMLVHAFRGLVLLLLALLGFGLGGVLVAVDLACRIAALPKNFIVLGLKLVFLALTGLDLLGLAMFESRFPRLALLPLLLLL